MWQKTAADRERDKEVYGDPEYRRNRPAAWKRAGGRCELLEDGHRCGSRKRCQVDHITPVSQGGTHHLGNLRVLCGFHHAAKTAQEGGGYRRHRSPAGDPSLQVRTKW
jgi:5-methylcytosine-specific restriction endonuclease McrA